VLSPPAANACVFAVGIIEAVIALVEMFCWKLPFVRRRLGYSAEMAIKVAQIVANAGLYNAFLALGLGWGVWKAADSSMTVYLLACVVVVGMFGAVPLKWTTLVLQTLPAAIALLAIWFSRMGFLASDAVS
jgi:putative membrane protein